MAEKTAFVRITADPAGLISCMDGLEKKTKRTAKVVQETLTGAIIKWVKDTAKATTTMAGNLRKSFGDLRKTISSIKLNKEGFLSALTTIDAKALVVARRMKSAFSSAVKGLGSGGGSLAKGVGGSLGLGQIASGEAAGSLIADSTKTAINAGVNLAKEANAVMEAANRLSISARAPGGDAVDPKQLAAEFYEVARNVKGVTAGAAADAASRFVSLTGDLATARSSLMDFADAAAASGAGVGEVAEAAASISQQFNVTDPRQIREVLAALIFQGKQGSFELKDAAAQFQRLAAAGAAFGIPKSAEGVKVLGGLTQIARSGTGSGEQASTAVENLLTNLKVKSGDLKKDYGVNVYDKKGQIRDVRAILVDAIKKVGGSDTEKKQSGLAQIFGQEGIRAINPLISLYNDSFKGSSAKNDAGRADAAAAAITAKLAEAISTTGTWSDVLDDSAQAQRNASGRLVAVYEDLKGKVGDALAPTIDSLVKKLEDTPGAVDGFVAIMEAAAYATEGFVNALDVLGYLVGDRTIEERAKDKVARGLETEARGVDRKLKSMQMSPEELAKLEKTDPKRLGKLRSEASELQLKRDSALSTAGRLRTEVTEGMEGRGDKSKLLQRSGLADKFRAGGASTAAPAQGAAVTRVDNEVKVRIMNPDDIKATAAPSGPTGAPTTPGYLPR